MVFLGSHSVEGRLDPGRSTAAYWVPVRVLQPLSVDV